MMQTSPAFLDDRSAALTRVLRLPAVDGAPGLELRLSLPEGPRPSQGRPVLIILEAEAYFEAAVQMARRLIRRSAKTRVDPLMILGVSLAEAPDRISAFVFTPGADGRDVVPQGAGLLRRLTDEILPLLVAEGADPDNVALMGHSMSGLFVLQARAAAAPFARYVAACPSIWWNPDVIAAQPVRSDAETDLLAVVGEREETPGLPPAHLARRMISNMQGLADAGGTRLRVLEDEDHGSTPYAALPAALRFASPLKGA